MPSMHRPSRLRLLLPAALLAAAAFAILRPPAGTSPATRSSPATGGDPFAAAGWDTAASPRIVLPGVASVTDAAETPAGWVLLDGRRDRIHGLDRAGTLLWSTGGEGRGPGELLRPVALTVTDSTVVVADARGRALDRFDLDGAFVGRTVLRPTDCMGNLVRGIGPWRDGAVVLLRLCLEVETGVMHVRADRVGLTGASTTLATLPLKSLRRPGADLLASGVLAVRPPRVYLGTTTSRCLETVGMGSASPGSGERPAGAGGTLCLPETDAVPLSGEERRRLDRALSRRPLIRALGVRTPEALPPFDRIFPIPGGVVFRTLTSAEGRALVRVRPTGVSDRLRVPATDATFVGRRSILVTWQEMAGTALRIVDLRVGTESSRAREPGQPSIP